MVLICIFLIPVMLNAFHLLFGQTEVLFFKVTVHIFCQFLNELLAFLLLVEEVLYIQDTSSLLSDICFKNISFQSVAC